MFIEREPWVKDAKCRGRAIEAKSSDEFFPPGGDYGFSVRDAAARAVCANCPVKVECLDYAMRNSIMVGIWGGLTGSQRRTMRRKQSPINEAKFRAEMDDLIAEEVGSYPR